VVRQVREERGSADIASRITVLFGLTLWAASVAAAQNTAADALTVAQRDAEKKLAAWNSLAKSLEVRIARLLPCDPQMKGAIEEASRASEARLAALTTYLQAAAAKAKDEGDAAKLVLANHDARARDTDLERTEVEQERTGIEGQLVNLRESVKRRAALAEAQKTLEGIAGMTQQRATQTRGDAARSASLGAALRDLVAAAQARQSALETELKAVGNETVRWSEYYTARLARAQTECDIINQTAAPARKRKQ
jgi:hypothetical protein